MTFEVNMTAKQADAASIRAEGVLRAWVREAVHAGIAGREPRIIRAEHLQEMIADAIRVEAEVVRERCAKIVLREHECKCNGIMQPCFGCRMNEENRKTANCIRGGS